MKGKGGKEGRRLGERQGGKREGVMVRGERRDEER